MQVTFNISFYSFQTPLAFVIVSFRRFYLWPICYFCFPNDSFKTSLSRKEEGLISPLPILRYSSYNSPHKLYRQVLYTQENAVLVLLIHYRVRHRVQDKNFQDYRILVISRLKRVELCSFVFGLKQSFFHFPKMKYST